MHVHRCAIVLLQDALPAFDLKRDYVYQEELHGLEGRPCSHNSADAVDSVHYGPQWAFLRFSQPVTAPKVR